MELRKLEIFCVVAYHESISRAAENLFISQPAVSKVIKEIEVEIGCLLFDRISGKIILNEDGKRFSMYANQLLEDLEKIKQFNGAQTHKKKVRVGVSRTIGEMILPNALKKYKEDYNQPVKVFINNVEEIKMKLLVNDIDFAFIEGDLRGKEFESVLVSSYPLVLVAKNNKNIDSLESLFNEPLLLREKGSSLRDVFEIKVRSQGWQVFPEVESISNEALIQLAIEGLGITILPEMIAKEYIKNGKLDEIKIIDFSLQSDNHLILLKNRILSHEASVFRTYLINETKKVRSY